MIGVILWSDPADQRAVIWCEDQGELAFASATACKDVGDSFFEVGEMVEFAVTLRNTLRIACDIRRLHASFGTALTKVLEASDAAGDDSAQKTAKIVPFEMGTPPATQPDPKAMRRRQG